MNKPDGFLKRWSRLKQEPVGKTPDEAKNAAAPKPGEAEAEFDPATLPPIESLGPDSDFTVFLKKGVPEALRLAALRKVWVLDPIIRNFRTPADYDWDFNAPGYGALRPTDDVVKMVDELLGPPQPANPALDQSPPAEPATVPIEAAAPPVPPPDATRVPSRPATLPGQAGAALNREMIAPKSAAPILQRRRHGGALPE